MQSNIKTIGVMLNLREDIMSPFKSAITLLVFPHAGHKYPVILLKIQYDGNSERKNRRLNFIVKKRMTAIKGIKAVIILSPLFFIIIPIPTKPFS